MAQARQKIIRMGNIDVTVYPLKDLAFRLNRRPTTVRDWELKKWIPKPIIQTKDGFRWYTKEEIDMIVRIAEEEQIMNGKSFQSTDFIARCIGEQAIIARELFRQAELGASK